MTTERIPTPSVTFRCIASDPRHPAQSMRMLTSRCPTFSTMSKFRKSPANIGRQKPKSATRSRKPPP
jgi:hypothetical protein